ncbi:MAG: hypothetical protein LBN43_09690 [Oscillospiraceae bacterium]|jgi:hypothetical protein|nr:hypothetical protein [Oscillospiraceae bacterium]
MLTNNISGGIVLSIVKTISNILPNADKAIIPADKFTKYSLNPDKAPDKASAFRLALGYSIDNYNKLIENIYRNIPIFEATYKGNNKFGDLFEVIMNLTGENGKSANVVTAWIIDNYDADKIPRLTNAYITNKKLKGENQR